MALDKWIAAFFLILCLVYGFAAFTYPLLPFERNMSFLPNTLPMALSVLGSLLALFILVMPKKQRGDEADALGSIDMSKLAEYKTGQALALIGAMVAYALLLRPAGFLAATALFLVGTGWILGERKLHIMLPVALAGAVSVWFLVQVALGIFLRPWPAFVG